MKVIYVFDCPIHGLEHQLLCFRAYNVELVDRWKKFELVESPMLPEDKLKMEDWIKNGGMDGRKYS